MWETRTAVKSGWKTAPGKNAAAAGAAFGRARKKLARGGVGSGPAHGLQHRAGEDRSRGGAVFGRDRIDVARGAVRSGAAHVLHHYHRIAGYHRTKMPRQQSRIGVVTTAR